MHFVPLLTFSLNAIFIFNVHFTILQFKTIYIGKLLLIISVNMYINLA